jgi:hypothetical protein
VEVPLQASHRDVQVAGEVSGAGGEAGVRGEQLHDAPRQQPVLAVLPRQQRDRPLQQLAERRVVTRDREAEIAGVEAHLRLRRVEGDAPREQPAVGVGMGRRHEREAGAGERDRESTSQHDTPWRLRSRLTRQNSRSSPRDARSSMRTVQKPPSTAAGCARPR